MMIHGGNWLDRSGRLVLVASVLKQAGKDELNRFVDPVQHEKPAFSFSGISSLEPIRTYLTAAGSHDLLFPSIHAPLGKNGTTTKPVSEWGDRREL
jgi:hypothetical protein